MTLTSELINFSLFTSVLIVAYQVSYSWWLKLQLKVPYFDLLATNFRTIILIVISALVGAIIWTIALSVGGIIGVIGFSIGGAIAGAIRGKNDQTIGLAGWTIAGSIAGATGGTIIWLNGSMIGGVIGWIFVGMVTGVIVGAISFWLDLLPTNTWLTTAGIFTDDPTLLPMLEEIYTARETVWFDHTEKSNPWLTTAGFFADDLTLEPMLEETYATRKIA